MGIGRYLIEISQDSPCGDYLEYDSDYLEMERLSKGSPEIQYGETVTASAEEGNWHRVKEQALLLLDRTRDIYVTVFWAMSEARLGSLYGVSQALALIEGLLDKFWDDVHPAKDPEDSYPILRMNALSNLNDFEQFIKPIRSIPLTTSKSFSFNLRDYEVVIGKIHPVLDEGKDKPTEEWLIASFKDSSEESLKRNLQCIDSIQASVEAISRITIEKVGAGAAPNLSGLSGQLKEMKQVFAKYADFQTDREPILAPANPKDHGETLPTNPDGADLVVAPTSLFDYGDSNMPGITRITTREQVSEAIDLICGYFEINEPASPIPLLLKRAQKLLDKDFIEIMQDLAPEGMNQAVNVCGIKDTEQS